jgi:CRISPR/Cas system Type II protein with McrA/HNH and RuvC-like nuclease domain
MTSRRLGLDLGTNSIGWCLLDLDKYGDPVSIFRSGVRGPSFEAQGPSFTDNGPAVSDRGPRTGVTEAVCQSDLDIGQGVGGRYWV